MVILRAFLALAAGLAVAVGLALALKALIDWLVPGWADGRGPLRPGWGTNAPAGDSHPPERGFGSAFVRLGAAFLAAAGGGYVTAWAGRANPLVDVMGLGMVVLALAAFSAFESRGRSPIWFQLSQVAVAPLGVLAGGLVRLRVLGIL